MTSEGPRVFSIVTPVFDPDHLAFEKCVRSVLDQTYPHWEWCLVDDCSTDPWVWKFLQKLARRHPNIKVARRESNGGISRTTNDAIAQATGDYLAFLDNDDELHLDALSYVNHELHLDPAIDFVYTDEDKIDDAGRHFAPFLKPDWSPERLLCQNYCSHFTVLRTDLVRRAGGLRPETDGAQDFDLLLRITDEPIRVRHIPRILYHWRVGATSHASNVEAKSYTAEATRLALEETCQRRGISADVVSTKYGYFRVRRKVTKKRRVSVIVPTRGTIGSLWGLEVPFIENLLLSSVAKTTYDDVEYVVVYDTDTDAGLVDRLRALKANVVLVEYAGRFNFSKKCNLGAIRATGEDIIFVNDDVEVITPDWIERLVSFLEDPTVGATGPLLLYDTGLIQSAGHVNRGPSNFGNGLSPTAPYGVAWPFILNREVSGVTGACCAMRRSTFFDMGGFSELFAESFNDVDLCMKLIDSGYRIIWTPDAEMFHFELKSRSRRMNPMERQLLQRLWGRYIGRDARDPFMPEL